MTKYLEFEKPVEQLDNQLEELRRADQGPDTDLSEEILRLERKKEKLISQIYSSLSPWDIVRVARHPQRPYSCDYIRHLMPDFQELHGDRAFGDDRAIICGLGRLGDQPVAVIAQEKGRTTKERVIHNFGMAGPEGYRKAKRVMELAERFRVPVVTFIDTPGAYPGIAAEERGISEAIATNLALMSRLRTPIICAVIGEGSSGGALGIGVGDHICMLQFSTYFVISPEGCANIIWKTAKNAADAAESMGVTSDSLIKLGLIDSIIEEPNGGAQRDPELTAKRIGKHLQQQLARLSSVPMSRLLQKRYKRLRSFGN